MMRSFRPGLPGAASLAINGLLLIALLQLGVGEGGVRKESPALKVFSLAVPYGSEEGDAERVAKPATPEKLSPDPVKPPPKAAPPAPVPVVAMPIPSLPHAPLAVAAPPAVAPLVAAQPEVASARPAPAQDMSGKGAAQPLRKGRNDGFVSDAPAGNSYSYAAKVRSWLYAHKTYPRRSRMRREEGIVRVQFVLDRRGHLLEGRVIQSSGIPALDQEGQAMLYRAAPYPAAPHEVPGERIEFTAPIEFILPT